jgi:endoglucanase
MRRTGTRLISAVLLLGLQLALAGSAHAAVRLSSVSYVAHDYETQATALVTRTNPFSDEYVRYGTHKMDSTPGVDYRDVGGVLHFLPWQLALTFTIPIVTHNFIGPPAHVAVYLYGSDPDPLGQPNNARLTILRDAPRDLRVAANPLALSPAPTNGDPLSGARFYVDRLGSPAAQAQRAYQHRNPGWARALSVIAHQPWTVRFGAWNGPDPSNAVSLSLAHSYQHDPGAVPLLATYRVLNGHCGNYVDPPWAQAAYRHWIDGLAYGIGNFRAVLFLEMDSLITIGCLNPQGISARLAELHYAIDTLERDPHLVVYVDAGAADAVPWHQTARLLNRAGVHDAQGFFLNATHFDATLREIAYGQKIARALGGVHFVVNTGANGQGPLVPADRVNHGNEVLCNPPGRGLGPEATTSTGYRFADAFAWTTNPGESGGACVPGAPPTGRYWPAYAVSLVHNAGFRVR